MKKVIIILVIIILLISGYYLMPTILWIAQEFQSCSSGDFNQNVNTAWQNYLYKTNYPLHECNLNKSSNNSKEVLLQQVNNLGYTFYLGQIDNTNNITDTFKNQITKIVSDAHIPKSILKNTPIIILNSLALTGGQYVREPTGALDNVPTLTPNFLSEGGLYGTYGNSSSSAAIIYLNKSIIASDLTGTLTHELGHAVGSKLTDVDWKKFYQLRNIPTNTPRQGTNWYTSPQEDFAEVFKYTFTGIAVRTYYGLLAPSNPSGSEMALTSCYQLYQDLYDSYAPKFDWSNVMNPNPAKIDYAAIEAKITANSKMQNCRRNVLANPSKYPDDWEFGTPYTTSVSQATKNFIVSIVNKLNN
jgi:hypothetical protein